MDRAYPWRVSMVAASPGQQSYLTEDDSRKQRTNPPKEVFALELALTPRPFETPQRDPAKPGGQPNPQNTGPSESNYSRYTSSLPNTPGYKKNINKTWSGPQPWKKENPREPASAGRGRTKAHCDTAPRRTLLSQRHWNQPPPRNRNGTSSATASSAGGGSFRKTMDSSDFAAKSLGQTRPDRTDMFVGTAMTIPNPEMPFATTSRSYLRANRKRSFSFSSNDDERFAMSPTSTSQRLTLHVQPSSLRSQCNAEKAMKKSLRQVQSQAQRPSILPPLEAHTPSAAAVAAAIEISEHGGDYFVSNSGSLRRTASRMSKRHIEAGRPLDPMLGDQEFMAAREGRLSMSNVFRNNSEYNDTGTVIRTADGTGGALPSETSGNTSRFTSWSDSVRRTSSGSSHQQMVPGLGPQHLPVITESEPAQPLYVAYNAPTPSNADCSSAQLQPLQAYPRTPTLRNTNSVLAPAISFSKQKNTPPRQYDKEIQESSSSPPLSSSSSSLARSGQGESPKACITPSALNRLHELSLRLQQACGSSDRARGAVEARGNTAKMQRDEEDPFYDSKQATNRFAFLSAPTTPAQPAVSGVLNTGIPTDSLHKQDVASPQYFFRGSTPYRRALQNNMRSIQDETAAARGRFRGDDGENQSGSGGSGGPQGHCDDDQDVPLLHTERPRQWSRVQAWQASLAHDSSTLTSSVADDTRRTPLGQSADLKRLERLHADSAVSPEQVNRWIKHKSEDGGNGSCDGLWR
ncbi:hypothetical protein F503_08507 [Ophiostoma piceae UAMH 11346]|uniref:Uncharacterized protein n=1 Tax=Ophiostoma piceae (strain UAMH 11346) TaxID=1262450 RepID=S3BNH6_OPHP1|nr:hypothetical protein F503_08507 [Ophiostoma piceae UAMH 11346]